MAAKDKVIDTDPAVREAARRLGVKGTSDLRQRIRTATVERLQRSMQECGVVPTTLEEVHQFVLNMTRMKVLRIEDDADLVRAKAEVARTHPGVHVQLEFEFARKTEALVVQRRTPPGTLSSQYLAVVDARAGRRPRAWFAERHEPTHILIKDPGTNRVWRRTKAKRPEPIEQVVDFVTSAVAFWEPLVRPVLEKSIRRNTFLLDAFEEARGRLAPDASKEASYRAFAALADRPLIVLFADNWCRVEDEPPDGDPSRSWALRARIVIPNRRADEREMRVWKNFRIPPDSAIMRAYSVPLADPIVQEDNLGRWQSESGRRLRPARVRVTSRGRWSTIEAA